MGWVMEGGALTIVERGYSLWVMVPEGLLVSSVFSL